MVKIDRLCPTVPCLLDRVFEFRCSTIDDLVAIFEAVLDVAKKFRSNASTTSLFPCDKARVLTWVL